MSIGTNKRCEICNYRKAITIGFDWDTHTVRDVCKECAVLLLYGYNGSLTDPRELEIEQLGKDYFPGDASWL